MQEFPDCGEGWANLGYARLMQYCDAQEPKDIRKFGIGPIVAGCFYARPAELAPVRGDEDELWKKAVANLEKAVEHDPKFFIPFANLGLAYLVNGNVPDRHAKADEHFRKTHERIKGDKGLNRVVEFVLAQMAEKVLN